MRKAKLICAVMGSVLMLTSTGCGNTIPKLTEEQTGMVTEYAAGLLLKYDKNYNARVEDTTQYHEQLQKEEEERQKEEEQRKKEETEAKTAEVQSKTTPEQKEPSAETLQEFFGISDVQIQYSGYEVCDSYPQGNEEEPVFAAVTATTGNKLLVLAFEAASTSAEGSELNILDSKARFRVRLNGDAEKAALFTFLPEELASYKGTISAGESVKTVVIFEISAEESEGIESIVFTVRDDNNRAVFNLQ